MNEIRLSGTVKRDATSSEADNGTKILDFAVEVAGDGGRFDIFDCRLTDRSEAFAKLEGFVEMGEEIELVGHLEKRTDTNKERISGAMVEVKVTKVIIYVDDVEVSDVD